MVLLLGKLMLGMGSVAHMKSGVHVTVWTGSFYVKSLQCTSRSELSVPGVRF